MIAQRLRRTWHRWWRALLIALLVAGYWLFPIPGQVTITSEGQNRSIPWPRLELGTDVQPDQTLTLWVTDRVAWPHVALTVNGQLAHLVGWQPNMDDTWTWEWTFPAPETPDYELVFYHDCHTGCVTRGHLAVGQGASPVSAGIPTKLGVVFANPEREWHGRGGWDVELTYAQLAEEEHWGIDDLSSRVWQAVQQGQRVLVRVDYAPGQSVPPAGDQLALTEYLQYLRRLARDERLRDVHGYVIGSGYNALNSNTLDPDHPVTARWYARVFNGYGEPTHHADNVVQVMRAEHPGVRLLVGPVRPWINDQGGMRTYRIDAPWLHYMDTLVAALDESARDHAAAGVARMAPDGFALQVAGRPGALELRGRDPAEEPLADLKRASWDGAQAGFRVYRDWLTIINAYPITEGTPVYLTAVNTYTPDEGTPPAQNYPAGWLTAAVEEIEAEPQVEALCWFLDYFPHDTQWEYFSLTRQPGRMADAAQEFDQLLRR